MHRRIRACNESRLAGPHPAECAIGIGYGDDFAEHSANIEIFAYVNTTAWNEFLAVREDVFVRLIDIVEESGTGFAFPRSGVLFISTRIQVHGLLGG